MRKMLSKEPKLSLTKAKLAMSCIPEALAENGTGQKWCSSFMHRVWFTLRVNSRLFALFFWCGQCGDSLQLWTLGRDELFALIRSCPTAASVVLTAKSIQGIMGSAACCGHCSLAWGRGCLGCPRCWRMVAEGLRLFSWELSPWLWTNSSGFAFSKFGVWSLNCSFDLWSFESTWKLFLQISFCQGTATSLIVLLMRYLAFP